MAENFDLFGDPIPPNWGRRGRPAHVRSTENINKVMMMLSLGWNNERMANALGITHPTFHKYYFSLVDGLRSSARDALDAEYAIRIWAQVQAGNVGAMRLWQQFIDRNDAAVGHSSFYADQRKQSGAEASAPKDEPVGKKQRAAQDAQRAGEGTDWGSDLIPN